MLADLEIVVKVKYTLFVMWYLTFMLIINFIVIE